MKFDLLKKHFGYDSFRPGQEALIDALRSGKDALGIMPTGGGKSICYQLPALLTEGITIVVSPLIALMKDQVDGLDEVGVKATYINSTLDWQETSMRLDAIRNGYFDLVYVAPERLLAEGFMAMCCQLDIALVAVDEAHCISQWGHDFRPSYRDIPRFIHNLHKRPAVGAFTATATKLVVDEIKILLELQSPVEAHTGFDRENLFYKVVKAQDNFKYVRTYLDSQPEGASGIIYCSTRKTVESLADKLSGRGYSVAAYHGGMSSDTRTRVQEDFMRDHIQIIVATNAFGMGIDKPDIRYVLHYNMPKNMESYYQEAGRAGRDGEPGECVLMYAPGEIVKQKFLITQNEMTPEREKVQLENLQYLINYCHSDECLRGEILNYFGETNQVTNCGSCGNCLGDSEYVDITVDAQKILSCVYRTRQRFGINLIMQTLRGSKNKKVLDWHLDEISTYGLLKDYSEGALREIIMNLIARGYLMLTADQFPVLKLTSMSGPVLKGEASISVKKERAMVKDKKTSSKKRKSSSKSGGGQVLDYDEALYELLSVKRAELAEAKGVPRFVVFGNSALEEMAYHKPTDDDSFLEIKGVGESKLVNYGKAFIDLIKEYQQDMSGKDGQ